MKDVNVFVFKASLGVYVEVVVIIQCEMDLILAMLLNIVDKINESQYVILSSVNAEQWLIAHNSRTLLSLSLRYQNYILLATAFYMSKFLALNKQLDLGLGLVI